MKKKLKKQKYIILFYFIFDSFFQILYVNYMI